MDSSALSQLQQQLDAQLKSVAPDAADSILNVSLPVTETKPQEKQLRAVSAEERVDVLHRLEELVTLPSQSLEESDQIYLEQVLSEMLGFSLAFATNSWNPPTFSATVAALPLYEPPSMSSSQDLPFPEAQPSRPLTGYSRFTPHGTERQLPDPEVLWQHSLAINPDWIPHNSETFGIDSVLYQPLTLINPFQARAVTGWVTDVLMSSPRYHIGASPNLTRSGQFWAPGLLGKCLIVAGAPSQGTTYTHYFLLPST